MCSPAISDWAVQNQHAPVVRCILDQYSDQLNVLEQNDFGQGSLTHAFATSNAVIVSMLLEHTSASSLEPSDGGGSVVSPAQEPDSQEGKTGSRPSILQDAANANASGICKGIKVPMPADSEIVQEHTHELLFSRNTSDGAEWEEKSEGPCPTVLVRELVSWWGRLCEVMKNGITWPSLPILWTILWTFLWTIL